MINMANEKEMNFEVKDKEDMFKNIQDLIR